MPNIEAYDLIDAFLHSFFILLICFFLYFNVFFMNYSFHYFCFWFIIQLSLILILIMYSLIYFLSAVVLLNFFILLNLCLLRMSGNFSILFQYLLRSILMLEYVKILDNLLGCSVDD